MILGLGRILDVLNSKQVKDALEAEQNETVQLWREGKKAMPHMKIDGMVFPLYEGGFEQLNDRIKRGLEIIEERYEGVGLA